MVTDFINWLYKYQNGNYTDVLNCFNYPGLHQFFHFVNYSIYRIIGTNTTAWYLVLTIMHGLNAFSLYYVLRYFTLKYKITDQPFLPLLVSITFLVNPFSIEAVVWKACLHYLIIFQCMIWGIYNLQKYWENTSKTIHLLVVHVLYIVALFTLELSFIFPFIYLVIIIVNAILINKNHLKTDCLYITLPQIIILALYLILSKISHGGFIGHYGAEKHVVLDFNLIFSNYWSYFFKNLIFADFYAYNTKAFIYTKLLANNFCIGFLTLSTSFVALYFILKQNKKLILIFSYLLLFFLALSPIITLYFYWQHPFENDRYNYFAVVFFILFLYTTISLLKHKNLKNVIYTIIVLINFYFFIKIIGYTKDASIVQHNILSSFEVPNPSDSIFILGMPDNFQGLYMFRDHKKNAHILTKSLSLMYDKEVKSSVFAVAEYNQRKLTDAIKVDFIDDHTIHVGFEQQGNWFWKGGVGMTDYDNKLFKVEKKPGYYKLTFNNPSKNHLFMFTKNNRWVQKRWPNQ